MHIPVARTPRTLLLGAFLSATTLLLGCPSTSPPDAGDEKDSGVASDARGDLGGLDGARPTDADGVDVPDVPADRGVPAACRATAVVDLNARGAADGGVLRYFADNLSASREPSLPATCVTSAINEAQYQVVHRYVPRMAGRLRVSVDDPGTDPNFDTVLAAQADCVALLPGEANLGCNNNVERSAAMRPRASEILTGHVNAGARMYIILSGNFGEAPIVPQGRYALSVAELPEVAIGATCDPAVRANACVVGASCLVGGTPAAPRCVADGALDTRCRVDADPDCDAGLRCALGFCRMALALNAPCGPDTAGVCPEGSVCQYLDGANRCLATGTRGADCRDEGTPCDAGLACVHTRFGDSCRTSVARGASCDPWGQRDACAPGSVCAFTATGGTCVAPGSAAGAPCGPSPTRCAAGATCQAVDPRCDPGLTCAVPTGPGQCQRAVAVDAACDLRTGSTRCTGGGCVRDGAATAACRADTAEVEPNDAPATATPLAATGAAVTGALTGTDTRDCVRVTVAAGGSLVAETATGDARVCALAGGDPLLTVYAPSGAALVVDDDSPGRGLCSTIAPWTHPQASGLPAGTYAVCVSRAGAPVPSYRLTVSALP
jgi:hypothetical protein